MLSRYSIAVVGSGIAGLAVAGLLKRQGHDVVIFEKFREARPVGSGLVLQQTGLAVLANLGLDERAISLGAKLTRFEGKTVGGRIVFDLSHDDLSSGHFSLGIHRHSLFSLLHGNATSSGVPVLTGFHASSFSVHRDKVTLESDDGRKYEGLDLIVDASGAHSVLRERYASIERRRAFAHGALWGVCEDPGDTPSNVLRQRFHRASVSVGLIPIGRRPDTGRKRYIGLHWSIRNSDYEAWLQKPLEDWKEQVTRLWPEVGTLVAQFREHCDLTWATYSDVALKRPFAGRLVYVGDSAHSISPRLGQGANLGLVDALTIARCLDRSKTIEEALRMYERERRSHVRFYHSASRWLSLLFQSDSLIAPALRDIGFGPASRLPYLRRQMLQSLSGIKTGPFSVMDLSDLHGNYRP